MFFEGNDVSVSLPTGYGKSLIYQTAPMINRLSSEEETGHYNCLLCRLLKLSWKARCTISMELGQEDCPPSTFGLFANIATKLLN